VTTERTPAAGPWLFGPARDLFLGCGLYYVIVFAALAVAGDSVRAALPLGLAFLPITFLSFPHYGATLLRAYGTAEDRRRYRFFTIWTTAVLVALFVWGVRDVYVGSLLATVYVTWSPWHYAGQNFGVGMMFLRRREVEVTPGARRLVWWSFALSYALTFVALHGETHGVTYAPDEFVATALEFLPLGIPYGAQSAAMAVLGAAYLAVTVGAFVVLRRKTSWRNLVPLAVLVVTQSLWFSVPALARQTGRLGGIDPLSTDHAHYVFIWIASGHAVQYLWITTYYAAQHGGVRRHAKFLLGSLLAGAAAWTLPALLFAPQALGRLPYDYGLALVVSSLVNLHHFVLDGAIWKLRDGRIARILLGAPPDAREPAARVRPALAWTAAAVGAACLAVALYADAETAHGFNASLEKGDVARADASARRLAWIGRDGAEVRLHIAEKAASLGDEAAAMKQYEASIDRWPTAWAWIGLGRLHARREDWKRASGAFDEALALEPDHAVALLYSGVIALEQGDAAEGRERLLHARATARRPEVKQEIEDVIRRYEVK
jgi:hypothetical protein